MKGVTPPSRADRAASMTVVSP